MRLARLKPLLLLIPLILLLPGVTNFPYPPGASFSDMVIAHYPYTRLIQLSLQQHGFVSLWSPLLFSGAPLMANPLAGLFYLPGWLSWALPLPLGFNLALALHSLCSGLGMWALLRTERLDEPASLLGALAWMSMPKWFAHYGAGHLTLLYALTWTPWLMWAARKSSMQPRWQWLQAVFLALIFLADPRWAVYAGILWLGYSLVLPRRAEQSQWATIRGVAFQGLMAAMLAAPLAVPLAEFTRLSTRVEMQAQDMLAFSLPPARLLGLLFPDFHGMHEWVVYFGGPLLLLGLLAIVWRRSLPGSGFWMSVLGITLLFSLGANLPGMSLVSNLPLLNLLRVPTRALFLSGMALAVLAAYSSNRIATLFQLDLKARRHAGFLMTALIGFALALSLGVWAVTGKLPVNFLWGSLALLIGGVWIALKLAGRIAVGGWWVGLFLICLLDWGVINRTLVTWRPAEQVLAEGAGLVDILTDLARQKPYRVYSPSYSLPQQSAVDAGLQLADGIDPLQLQAVCRFHGKSQRCSILRVQRNPAAFFIGQPRRR